MEWGIWRNLTRELLITVASANETNMSAMPKRLDEVLHERIQTRTGRRVAGLSVEVQGETVVIRGRSNSFHVKQLAQHGVRDILPTAPLRNGIVVSQLAG